MIYFLLLCGNIAEFLFWDTSEIYDDYKSCLYMPKSFPADEYYRLDKFWCKPYKKCVEKLTRSRGVRTRLVESVRIEDWFKKGQEVFEYQT